MANQFVTNRSIICHNLHLEHDKKGGAGVTLWPREWKKDPHTKYINTESKMQKLRLLSTLESCSGEDISF